MAINATSSVIDIHPFPKIVLIVSVGNSVPFLFRTSGRLSAARQELLLATQLAQIEVLLVLLASLLMVMQELAVHPHLIPTPIGLPHLD